MFIRECCLRHCGLVRGLQFISWKWNLAVVEYSQLTASFRADERVGDRNLSSVIDFGKVYAVVNFVFTVSAVYFLYYFRECYVYFEKFLIQVSYFILIYVYINLSLYDFDIFLKWQPKSNPKLWYFENNIRFYDFALSLRKFLIYQREKLIRQY